MDINFALDITVARRRSGLSQQDVGYLVAGESDFWCYFADSDRVGFSQVRIPLRSQWPVTVVAGADSHADVFSDCLLYTSPSPRDPE